MNFAVIIIAIAFAVLIGVYAHRARLCAVGACEELLARQRPRMLICFLKGVLWVMAITISLEQLAPGWTQSAATWRLSLSSILGGLVFGIGAGINHACAISTLRDAVDGRFAIIGALIGMYLGFAAYAVGMERIGLPEALPGPPLLSPSQPMALVLLALLCVWGAREIIVWARMRSKEQKTDFMSEAAAVVGISNGILYAFIGAWTYTGLFRQHSQAVFSGGEPTDGLTWFLLLAVIAGMFGSSLLTGRFRPRWKTKDFFRYLTGGLLMGLGAAMAPGGNDVLLLHSIPSLSAHALPAFVGMLAGITLVLVTSRIIRR